MAGWQRHTLGALHLTVEDCHFILTSLEYTRQKFSEYRWYPTEDFRRQRLADVQDVIDHVRSLRDLLKHGGRK